MKLIVEKGDVTWLQKNGYISQEQVGVVWDQLGQKCQSVQEEGTSSNFTALKKELDLPQVQGFLLGEPSKYDICIAFSFKNGETLAKIGQRRRNAILISDSTLFDAAEIETRIASSTSLLVLLTEECLKQPEIVFALHVAKFYYQHPSLVVLVHDAESCYFPGYDEQPESVKEFFSEKAVTFLNCFLEDGVKEIISKFDSEVQVLANIVENFRQNPSDALFQFLNKNESRGQFSIKELRNRMKPFMTKEQLEEFEAMADKNKDGILDSDEVQEALAELRRKADAKEQKEAEHDEEHSAEDLTTRVFLSHKRSTGQGIAGRLYEGLKKSYKVFIDSEAKFKIHNLKLIVQSTDVFVFILSYGIFLSKWCLEELKSALENKKRVIVVRELSFKLPAELPEEWKEVEPVIRNSRELVWLAEYNTSCVKALHDFIGSPDERNKLASKYLGKATLKNILNRFQSHGVLDLNRTIPLPPSVEVDGALDLVLESIPAEEIKTVHITCLAEANGENDSILTGMFSRLPKVQELSLAGSGGIVTNAILQEICSQYPALQKLDLEQCVQLTSEAMEHIKELGSLTELNLSKISGLTDYAMDCIANGCPKLEVLKIDFAELTHKVFAHLSKITTLKEVELPFHLKKHPDAKKFQEDHPNVKLRMEPIIFDVQASRSCTWHPAIVTSFTSTHTSVHLYGRCYEESLTDSQWAESAAKFRTHENEYGYIDPSDCQLCAALHAELEHTRFGGNLNPNFVNEWFLKEEEGTKVVQRYLEQASKGQLQICCSNLPKGLKPETFLKGIAAHYPLETIKELYVEPETAENAAGFLKTLPHLKVLSYIRKEVDVEQFKTVTEVFPPDLEEFSFLDEGISDGCAELLAAKIQNVNSMHLNQNWNSELTEKGLLALFKENSKLKSLTLRCCGSLTPNVLLKIGQHCKEIVNLDLTLNKKLAAKPDLVITHLISNFPALKTLSVDLAILKSPKFEEFRSARPDVVVEFEKLYMRDIFDPYAEKWYPAVQYGETKGPNPTIRYHLYGNGRQMNLSEIKEGTIQPVLSAAQYGPQDVLHCRDFCNYCDLMNPVCEHLDFQGKPNEILKNIWFFDSEEGKELLKKFEPQGEENRITFDVSLPEGIYAWGVVRALAKQLDLQKTYILNLKWGVKEAKHVVPKMLEQPLPIVGIELGTSPENYLEAISESEKAPKITRLVVEHDEKYGTPASWAKLNLPELLYLDVSGCPALQNNVSEGIAKSTKLTYLNLAGTDLTDASITVLAKNWTNMNHLDLRSLTITEKSVEAICQNCSNLQSLSLALCHKVASTACQLISTSLPNLKELKVPFHWRDTEDLAGLKSTRPEIQITEKSELIDWWDGWKSAWFPAAILLERRGSYKIHCYGTGDEQWIEIINSPNTYTAPIFSNLEEYGSQYESHVREPCRCCEGLHPIFEEDSFGGSSNLAFINKWYFESSAGIALISTLAGKTQASGKLELPLKLPVGLSYEKTVQAVLKETPSDLVRHIHLRDPVSVEALENILTDKTELLSITLCGQFTDGHALVIANICPFITGLNLQHCKITDVGLASMGEKIHSLETLVMTACKEVTNKAVEALMQENKSLETIELDTTFQISADILKPIAKLPRLITLTVGYYNKPEFPDAILALKKKKPALVVKRGHVLVDVSDGFGWYVGIAKEFKDASKSFTAHLFGIPPHADRLIEYQKHPEQVAEVFTHTKDYYDIWSQHMQENCPLCTPLQPLCANFLFNNKELSTFL